MPRGRWFRVAGFLICVYGLSWQTASAGSGALPPAPRGERELQACLKQLRGKYAPFLRSLPPALAVRTRTVISGPWRSRYELELAKDGPRPEPPQWQSKELDEADWQATSVPEWRYRAEKKRWPASCALWYRTQFEAAPAGPGKRVFLVFEGVDWEAEVWLNGRKLGTHCVYYEPFRFDVTGILEEHNTLAVRVTDGPRFGEPAAYWSLFPVPPAKDQRYVRDKSQSLAGLTNGDLHIGSGYGIHREVYLETTGNASISEIFVRADLAQEQGLVKIETEGTTARSLALRVQALPENFDGPSFEVTAACQVPRGKSVLSAAVAMPAARRWTPESPCLYRCRVTLSEGSGIVDGHDVLFGYRSFDMVSEEHPRPGLLPGTLLLNEEPIYLRGTNIQGLNALWYWGEQEKLVDVLLLLKAGHFNAVRSCQHVQYPEVREFQDRLGIMSQQDQGSRYPKLGKQTWPHLVRAATALARVTYNNPGVVLLSYANETAFDPKELLAATLKCDPQRIVKPISGHPSGGRVQPNSGRSGYELSDAMWANVTDDVHPYLGWYGYPGQIWRLCQPLAPDRLVTVGEYGAEALDGYQTMSRHYPTHWQPTPARESETLWGQVQVQKADVKQIVGFRGRKPSNLGEYIQASQTYQADVCSEVTKSWRLSPRRVAGYFHFHFVDVNPANWPKSIVSHDLRPKQAYYEMAQINQLLVPLPRLIDRGSAMELWVANDLARRFDSCTVNWSVRKDGKILAQGQQTVTVPPLDAVLAGKADLADVPSDASVVTIRLVLSDSSLHEVSRYERGVFLRAWRLEEAALRE